MSDFILQNVPGGGSTFTTIGVAASFTPASIHNTSQPNYGIELNAAGVAYVVNNATQIVAFGANTSTEVCMLGSGGSYAWSSGANPASTSADTNISRNAAGVIQIGTTAQNTAGNLALNRINIAGADFAGTATITAAATTVTVNYAVNYTGTSAPIVVVTPTSDPLAAGVPVGIWVTANGSTGAWTGFTINIQSALLANLILNYVVIG
jgi:hypothetical protein